jgi:hypothetical protein
MVSMLLVPRSISRVSAPVRRSRWKRSLFEQRVAEIVEQHAAEAGQCIGGDQRHRHAGPARQIVGHRIERQLQRVRHGEHDALGQQHEAQRADNAQFQIGAIGRP